MTKAMTIDAHQHFWRYDPYAYTWIRSNVLQRDYLPGDLKPLLEAAGVDGTVAVQARSTGAETTWLLSLAESHPWIVGVVGWADPTAPDLRQRLTAVSENPALCGIRCGLIADSADAPRPREDFTAGIRVLAELGLAFDLLVRPPHLPLARAVAASVPEQRFILDHIAKPLIADHVLEPWASDLKRLAALPNVACKLSGMVTEAHPTNWRAQDFEPYLDLVFEAFGADRLMIGSDWPVCRQAAEYGSVLRIAEDYIAALSASERAAVLGRTAIRWYDLGL
jgi:L-fuconolactonase